MCGIAFWFAKPGSKWRPTKHMISSIVTELEMRGRDATGMATLKADNELSIYKGALPAREWVESFNGSDDVPIGRIGILHTRGANVGPPEFNYNNHPLPFQAPNRPGVAVVHNGTVYNLDKCYGELGLKQHADVDSALIAASLGTLGLSKGLQFLGKFSGGSGAIAALDDEGRFAIARDGSPLWLGSPEPGVLVGASTAETIRKFCVSSEFGVNIWQLGEYPNLTYTVWDPKGDLQDEGRFCLPGGGIHPPYFRDRNELTPQQAANQAREKEAEKEKEKVVDIGARGPGCGFRGGEPGRKVGTDEETLRLPPDGERDIDHDFYITCHWRGCWNKARTVILIDNTQVCLCGIHLDKARKRDGEVTVSPAGELNRKSEKDVEREEERGAKKA